MGPAPTRLPRIAFPPPGIAGAPSLLLVGQQQAEGNYARKPDHTDTDGDPVEVALCDRRSSERARHSAAEHVGQAAPTALVEQDEHDEQEARGHEQDREEQSHGRESYVT